MLLPAVDAQDSSLLSREELSALSGLLPRLGASFLEPLPTPRLLELLTAPGVPSYPPAQVRDPLNHGSVEKSSTLFLNLFLTSLQASLLLSRISEDTKV